MCEPTSRRTVGRGTVTSRWLFHVDGATGILQGGFVAYTKTHEKALGVSAALLKREGQRHGQVAQQLVRGALKRSRTNAALSVTGVLGPVPDEDGKPVGLVYFCFGLRDRQRRSRSGFRARPPVA